MTSNTIIDPTILREYDIRGIVNSSLTKSTVALIGLSYGSILIERGCRTIAVGFDGRLSSPSLEAAFVEGLLKTGLHIFQIGRGPTPMLYFAVHHLKLDAGAMITGSHNPPEYNGIKMVCKGMPFWGPDIKEIGRRVRDNDFIHGEGSITTARIFEHYVDRLLSDYKGKKMLRVAWDPGNGAAGEVIRTITENLPGDHFLINDEIDGSFPAHHPDPTVEENLSQLKRLVIDKKCDIGIAFDGDGDRIGIIDNNTRILWGDQILMVLAREVLSELPGSIVITDVKASRAFFDEIERLGGEPLMYKTGHSLIKNKMQETGAPLAGEMSAHIFIKHRYYGYDDAAYAAIRFLSILANSPTKLSQIYDELPQYYNTPELRFPCPEKDKKPVIKKIECYLQEQPDISINNIDGLRVENKHGWWLLRASNTQDVLVARCESASQEGLTLLKKELSNILEKVSIKFDA